MVRLVSFLFLLFSFPAFALVDPSGVPAINAGCAGANGCGVKIDPSNSQGWFSMTVGGSVTSNQFRAFVSSGGTQYRVPAGNGITCYHMTFNCAVGGVRMQIASSTTADGITAASLTTGQKYETGQAASFPHVATNGQTEYDKAIAYPFDALAYPYIASDTTDVWGVTVICKPN